MKNKKGFTLVELLAVIILIAIISTIVVTVVVGRIKKAQKDNALNSARSFTNSITSFLLKNELEETENNIENGTATLTVEQLINTYNFSYTGQKPTNDSWVGIKDNKVIVYSLKIGNYVINYNIYDGQTISDDEIINNEENVTTLCKRATKLHTELCMQTSTTQYCSVAGYTTTGLKGTTTITYGNLGIKGKLTSGDAFDCDVNGDGVYNEINERFYYLMDIATNVSSMIYYNNVASGVASSTYTTSYDSTGSNWYGPRTLVLDLPKTSQWTNVSLNNTARAIVADQEIVKTTGGTLPTKFDYSPYSARLLTMKEIETACKLNKVITTSSRVKGDLDNCNYLLENTMYSTNGLTYGYWIENPYSANNKYGWLVYGNDRWVGHGTASVSSSYTVRPVIEVSKFRMEY